MKAETIDEEPRRRRWPWIAVALVVLAGVGALLWRFVPPAGGTMDEVRSGVVLYEGVFAPLPPKDARPGRPLSERQRASLEEELLARLEAACTPTFVAENKSYARRMAARVSRELARGDVSLPTHPYEYVRDLEFAHRTWGGEIVFNVYEPGDVKVRGAPAFLQDSSYVAERYVFEKVDGRWRIAGVTHFGA